MFRIMTRFAQKTQIAKAQCYISIFNVPWRDWNFVMNLRSRRDQSPGQALLTESCFFFDISIPTILPRFRTIKPMRPRSIIPHHITSDSFRSDPFSSDHE